MSWFKNLNIRAKMIVSFGVVIAMTAFLAFFAVMQLRGVDTAYNTVLDFPVLARGHIQDFNASVNDVRRLGATISNFAFEADSARIDGYYNQGVAALARGEAALKAYDDLVHTNPNLNQEGRDVRLKQTQDLRVLFNQYWTSTFIPVADTARKGDQQGTINIMLTGAGLMGELAEAADAMLEAVTDSRDSQKEDARNKSHRTELIVIAIAAAILILAVIIALYIAGLISKPLTALSGFMKHAGATGDITLNPKNMAEIGEFSKAKDEIGDTVGATASFLQHVMHISQELDTVASGDLTTEIELLSDTDIMGKALVHMVDSLNTLFGEINNSTAQVATGAKQIADGSQALAQGSTEQAASVEELSSSISEIAQQTKDNAVMAGQAASLAGTIKHNAEKGSRQMDEMMAAVKDINQASQSIQRVIKVIDDIAFQTNILALNAAVEAARAGQHGKGFAVVAEEVRNLASKSAEAAKETGAMIEDSMGKAELGSQIAGETAVSLAEIVHGINESSQIVEQIASSSEQQSAGIEQINSGIDQVAQVVQQNSATAEESAAASEEMSGQSAMLEDLVAQFKLKDGGMGRKLPPRAARKEIAMPEKTSPNGSGDFGKY